MIFRIIAALVILTVIVWFHLQIHRNRSSWSAFLRFLWQQLSLLKGFFSKRGGGEIKNTLVNLRATLLGVTGWLFLLMLISGFGPILVMDGPLSGWPLIIHVTVAPFFVFSLAGIALLFALNKQFIRADLNALSGSGKDADLAKYQFLSKFSFWLFLLVSVPAILSVILSMFPLFSTAGLENMVIVHQYTTLALFLIASVYVGKRWQLELRKKK